jgi:DNA-binding MarR family transcriptional regulator
MSPEEKEKILEDINRFDTSRQRALVNLIYTNGYLMVKMNELFRKYKVSRSQFNILRLLRLNHPNALTQSYIRNNMVEKMPDISRIVERMRVNGYLLKEKRVDDMRNVYISITEKGLNVIESVYASQNDFDELINCLSDKEVEALNEILHKIRDNIF